jgi:hypothetical protein
MYGWILASLESMILNKFGTELWSKIQEAAHIPVKTGEFIKNVHYSEEIMFNLLQNSTKILNVPQIMLMEYLGENFVNFIREHGYDSTIRAHGDAFDEFLQNINEPHRLLRSRFPESYLPEFSSTKTETDGKHSSCILHYYSTRGVLFYPMVVGLLREVAKQLFNVSCSMDFVSQTFEEDYVHTTWKVHYHSLETPPSSSSIDHHHHPSLTSHAPHRVVKCPFSGLTHHASQRDCHSHTKVHLGLSYKRLCKVFLFHLVINQDMEIVQYGKQLKDLLHLHNGGEDVLEVERVFNFQTPPNLQWKWEVLKDLEDTCVELFAKRIEGDLIFRGEVMILDPSTDVNVKEPFAMLLLNPGVNNIDELEMLKMKLSDFPVHGFQRDLIVLGQHMLTEQCHSIELDVLSRKLDEERMKSLNSLKTKRVFVRYVSHEIRSPLNTAILGLKYVSDQIKQNTENEKSVVIETINEVKNSCAVAVDILNDLLLYEKFDDGIFALSKAEVRVSEYFSNAFSVYKVQVS